VANGVLGNPNDDIVVMDDFIYATPTAVPEPGTALFGLGLLGTLAVRRRGMRSS
jgi:MYXO-CTERM domain-containing protein